MHNGQTVRVIPRDKASAAAAMPYGAWTVCTLITHGSGALLGFTSSTFVTAALDQVGGKKEKKKTYAVQVDSCSCSRRQLDNKL